MKCKWLIGVVALGLALSSIASCTGQVALGSTGATPTVTPRTTPNADGSKEGKVDGSENVLTQSADRGWLGVTLETAQQGVRVASVMAGSPADKAGVKQGDVIVRVDGNRVRQTSDVIRAVASVKVGEQVNLTVLRDGEEVDITVTASKRPGSGLEIPAGARSALESWLSQLPGLENLKPEEVLQHFVRADVTLLDKDGQEIKLTMVAGRVKSIADDSITIDPNGQGANPESYRITGSTAMREGSRKIGPGDIRVGDTVVVITKEDSSDALAVLRIVDSRVRITLPRPSSIPGWDALRERLRGLGLPALPEILVPDPKKDYDFRLN